MKTVHVLDIMTPEVHAITRQTALADVARRMRDLDVGFLPVVDNEEIVGVVTDRDVVIRGLAQDGDVSMMTAEGVMTADYAYCFEYDDTIDVAERMEREQIRRLLVLNERKRAVGIVSLGDLAIGARDPELTGEVTEVVAEDRVHG